MAIVRTEAGNYVNSKKPRMTERKREDYDIAWNNFRVYIIDSHEWFDPHTSSKYLDGVSRHAYRGPSLIVATDDQMGYTANEYHVNDPIQWAWIRRSIAEGHLSSETILSGVNDEKEVVVK